MPAIERTSSTSPEGTRRVDTGMPRRRRVTCNWPSPMSTVVVTNISETDPDNEDRIENRPHDSEDQRRVLLEDQIGDGQPEREECQQSDVIDGLRNAPKMDFGLAVSPEAEADGRSLRAKLADALVAARAQVNRFHCLRGGFVDLKDRHFEARFVADDAAGRFCVKSPEDPIAEVGIVTRFAFGRNEKRDRDRAIAAGRDLRFVAPQRRGGIAVAGRYVVDANQLEIYRAHRLETAANVDRAFERPADFSRYRFHLEARIAVRIPSQEQMYRPRDQRESDYRKNCEPSEFWLVTQIVGEQDGHGGRAARWHSRRARARKLQSRWASRSSGSRPRPTPRAIAMVPVGAPVSGPRSSLPPIVVKDGRSSIISASVGL